MILIEHKQIQSKYGTTHYWISHHQNPSALCIVFTHGLTANHTMFEKQVKYFASKYTVLTWDVPLHGQSRPYQAFSYRQTAVELHSILEREHITKVILVGMSMGGYPSQMFASLFPDRVKGFVALDTTPFGIKYYSKWDLWWLRQVAPMASLFPDRLLRKSMAQSVSKTKYAYQKMMEMLSPLTKTQIIEQMEIAYGQFAVENQNILFEFPVLILLGDSDKIGKVHQYCEVWAESTGYPLHIIHNAAHFSNGDQPEQVNAEIASFIQGCENDL